jgi:hypothetical protein
MHAADLDEARDKLTWFLTGWLGGPQLYVERFGHPRLRARHLPFPIDTAARDQWMAACATPWPLRSATSSCAPTSIGPWPAWPITCATSRDERAGRGRAGDLGVVGGIVRRRGRGDPGDRSLLLVGAVDPGRPRRAHGRALAADLGTGALGWVALARAERPGGRYLEPLELAWGLACPLVGPDPAALTEAFLAAAADDPDWDADRCSPGSSPGSAHHRALRAAFARAGASGGPTTERYVASLDGGVDGFLARRTRNFRKAVRADQRLAAAAGIAVRAGRGHRRRRRRHAGAGDGDRAPGAGRARPASASTPGRCARSTSTWWARWRRPAGCA